MANKNKFDLSVVIRVVDKVTRPMRKAGQSMARLSRPVRAVSRGFVAMGRTIRRTVAKISRSLKKLGKGFRSLASKAASMSRGLALGLTGAAVGVAALVTNLTGSADAIAKTSDALGISTDQLQEWQFAASQSGIRAEEFTTSLRFFQKGIADAKEGIGEAGKAFEKLGIGAKNTDGTMKTTRQLFLETAEAISKIKDPAERTQTAMRLFGRAGIKMNVLFKNGAQGIADYEQKARDLGLVIKEGMLRNSETLNDRIDMVTRAIKANASMILGEFLPSLIQAGEGITQWIAKNRELIKQKILGFIEGVTQVLKGMGEALTSVITWVKDLWNSFKQLTGMSEETEGKLSAWFDKFGGWQEVGKALGYVLGTVLVGAAIAFGAALAANPLTWVAAAVAGLLLLEEKFGLLSKSWEFLKGAFDKFAQGFKGAWDIAVQALKPFTDLVKSFFANITSWFGDAQAPVIEWGEVFERIGRGIGKIIIGIAKAIGGVAQAIIDVIDWVKKAPDKFKEWSDKIKEFFSIENFKNIGMRLVDGLLNGIKAAWAKVTEWFWGTEIGKVLKGTIGVAQDVAEETKKAASQTSLGFQKLASFVGLAEDPEEQARKQRAMARPTNSANVQGAMAGQSSFKGEHVVTIKAEEGTKVTDVKEGQNSQQGNTSFKSTARSESKRTIRTGNIRAAAMTQ